MNPRVVFRRPPAAGVALALAAGIAAALPAAAELTAEQQRGKVIYLEGTSPAGGEITAVLAGSATEVPASVMPCGGCHGRDGRGRPEGGVFPSNLTWPALTKAYGVEHPGGRRHPPYTEAGLKWAITMGVDPGGNRLHVAMPRYRLSHQDMEDLVAYIRRLGDDPDPGLTDKAIAIATLVPKEGSAASLGAAIEAVLRAYFDDVNRGGGIYHRRLELAVEAAPAEAGARVQALRRLLESGEVFALVGVFLPGAEEEITAVAAEHETPLIGPFTLFPQIDVFSPNPYVFYLLPGLEDLGRALVRFAAEGPDPERPDPERSDPERSDPEPRRAAVVAGPGLGSTVQAIVGEAAVLGWGEVRRAGDEPEEVAALSRGAVDTLFLLLAGDRQAAFLQRAAELGWYPRVLLPGALLGRGVFAAPPGFAGRIFAAFSTLPSNQDPESAREVRELAARHGLPAEHAAAQIVTLGAARVLVEGLKRAGRELSRGRLIEVLEGFSELDIGLTPPVTYGPNRRVGIRGAYVLEVDLAGRNLVLASGWVGLR